jgi:hypothetical protein
MKNNVYIGISALCAILIWTINLVSAQRLEFPVTPSPVITRPTAPQGNNTVSKPGVIETPPLPVVTKEGEKCVSAHGSYEPTYRECAGISETTCGAIGGKFVPCGSSCRHDPKAQICNMMCVIYCQL